MNYKIKLKILFKLNVLRLPAKRLFHAVNEAVVVAT